MRHVPDEFVKLIHSLYTDNKISVLNDSFLNSPISVRRGTLQGDSISPLLFNPLTNTLINTIKEEKLNCLGNVCNGYITPKQWFQFVDDTALVSALKSDNTINYYAMRF